jgi:hypothetical protein
MKNFGKNVNIKSKKKKELSEKEIFTEIISLLDDCFERSSELEQSELNITSYEEPFYIMIENLLFIKYGEWKTDIILWWVYNRYNEEGEVMPIKLNDHVEDKEEEVLIETSEQLWDFLKRIDNIEKNK